MSIGRKEIARTRSGDSSISPTYADLFTGCAGLSPGLEWAGFGRIAAQERSPDAVRSYYHNLVCRKDASSITWTIMSYDHPRFLPCIVAETFKIENGLLKDLFAFFT